MGEKWTTVGVLQCIGYLIDPRVELVFRIPSNLRNPKSLKSLVARNSNGNEPARKPAINSRVSPAITLSESVLLVHYARLVHESIKLEKVLVFEKWDKDET